MQVLVNADRHIVGGMDLTERVRGVVLGTPPEGQVTSIEALQEIERTEADRR